MAKVRLKGLHYSKVKLSDGTYKYYYYAWRGGPRLDGELGSPEFIASFNAAHANRHAELGKTIASLVRDYSGSQEFCTLAEATQKDYRRHLRHILEEFDDLPLVALADPEAREVFLDWRDMRAQTSPRQADYAWTVLARVFSWGLHRGKIKVNPCEKAGRLYRGSRIDIVWSDEQEAAFLAHAPPQMKLAFLLAIWTGQRQGDLLRLSWTAYDGQVIRLMQRKSVRRGDRKFAVRVTVPVSATLKEALDAASKQKASPIILVNSFGKPWTPFGFRTSWQRVCKAAGIAGVTFHDLRGTAVTRLAVAGCTEAEIASITGHKIGDVRNILDAHYLHRDPSLSSSAIRKLEESRKKRGFDS